MRMWMLDPKLMCRKHLLGEHVETHMFLGTFKKKIKVTGYLQNNLLEPRKVKKRHDQLAKEMLSRDYNHNSPLQLPVKLLAYLGDEVDWVIDEESAQKDLHARCLECKRMFEEGG